MNEQATYQKIVDQIREEIYTGVLKPGEGLPGVREMSVRWHCTPGTVQRAYSILAKSGLIASQPGKGTVVIDGSVRVPGAKSGLRKAGLVIRTEQFLLECATAGYSLDEITEALTMATEHWRILDTTSEKSAGNIIRMVGSSDTVVNALAGGGHPGLGDFGLLFQVVGSMSGLMALAQGNADLAGCHLWDAETDSYNLPFIKKLMPSKPVRVVTFAHRRLGLITQAGNPKQIRSLADLNRTGVRMINRQNGSGTRVWLDGQLQKLAIQSSQIQGYDQERATHLDVAREIAEGNADVGIGLESAAAAFGLDFQLLTRERYDLVMDLEKSNQQPLKGLITWLQSTQAREYIESFPGYETGETGRVIV